MIEEFSHGAECVGTGCYSFLTDFEYIYFEEGEFDSYNYIQNEDVLFIRFIKKSFLHNKFPENQVLGGDIDKFFFLPTHKEKEFKRTINEEERDGYFSDELRSYYTEKMIAELKPSGYYTIESIPVLKGIKARNEASTSLFVLYNSKSKCDEGALTDRLLKKEDVPDINSDEIRDFLLNNGLKICEQLPLRGYLVAVGYIGEKQGILEWCTALKTQVPDSSHVNFFKGNYEKINVDFQDVANQFVLLDKARTADVKNIPKRKNSKRRRSQEV